MGARPPSVGGAALPPVAGILAGSGAGVDARATRVIDEGLAFFVGRLAAARQAEVWATQAALPVGAPAAARLVALVRSCPVLHKLAQVVARHPALDPGVRRELRSLEMAAPGFAPGEIDALVRRHLEVSGDRRGIILRPELAIEGSVALVVPCRGRFLPDGERSDAVLKILKPGVADRLEEELDILVALGDHLDERCEALGFPTIDYRDAFVTVRDLLRSEVRLDLEQEHLVAARAMFAMIPRVRIPAVLPLSTRAMTVMERVDGVRVTDVAAETEARNGFLPRRALADLVVRAVLATPVFDPSPSAMFHADPHAGNLFATPDGRLAMLDWSLAGHLGKRERIAITGIFLAAFRQDTAGVARSILDLADRAPLRSDLDAPIDAALRDVRRGRLPGPGWLVDLLDGAVERGTVFPASLMLFRKSLLTLNGVVADVDPRCSVDAVFIGAAMRALAGEWPRRLTASPFSRDFATHASNLDLASVWACAPAALMGCWSEVAGDWWRAITCTSRRCS